MIFDEPLPFFSQLLEMGEKLIKAGYMYGDDTGVEQMREVRICRLSACSAFNSLRLCPAITSQSGPGFTPYCIVFYCSYCSMYLVAVPTCRSA